MRVLVIVLLAALLVSCGAGAARCRLSRMGAAVHETVGRCLSRTGCGVVVVHIEQSVPVISQLDHRPGQRDPGQHAVLVPRAPGRARLVAGCAPLKVRGSRRLWVT